MSEQDTRNKTVPGQQAADRGPSREKQRVAAPARRKRALEYVVVVVIVLLTAAGVAAFAFWQQEISVFWAYQPWRSGPYNDLVQRLYHGAEAGDSNAVAAVLDPRATPIVHEKKTGATAIQYGGGMLTRTITLKELAARGPFRITRLEPQFLEPGGIVIHTDDRSEKPFEFVVRRRAGGALRITNLITHTPAAQPPPAGRQPRRRS